MNRPMPPEGTAEGTAERTVVVDGVRLGRGSRVRLRPSRRADVLDTVLHGRTAEVESVEEDVEGRIHVVVTLERDDGRDFPTSLGHRFFFSPAELEPVAPATGPAPRIMVAGIGNVFLADDAFGPEVIGALRDRDLPEGVHVADFGIRGMDLAYRLLDGYRAAVLVDAAPRGGPPGTVYVIEPDPPSAAPAVPEAHGMDPVGVLALAHRLAEGAPLPRVLVLGCEPMVRMTGAEPDVVVGLSPPVRAAVGVAVARLEELLRELREEVSQV